MVICHIKIVNVDSQLAKKQVRPRNEITEL